MATGSIEVNNTKVTGGYIAATLESNKVSTTHVTFPSAFASISQVVACLGGIYAESAHGYLSNVSLSVINITDTGFDLLVGYNGQTTQTSAGVRWIAFGR